MQPEEIVAEMDRVRADFRRLLDGATSADLARRSDGTLWSNEQLLFHMLLGYLLTRVLLPIVRGFSRVPVSVSRGFASGLNAGTRPFHRINYVGSLGGARVLGHARMQRLMDLTIAALQRDLLSSSGEDLRRGMFFPIGWDPYFRDFMSALDVCHYATQHYDHHRRQLTLANA